MANLKNTTIDDTGFLKLPAGDESQKPEVADTGMIRFNTDSDGFEVYDGEEWRDLLLSPPAVPPGQETFDEPGTFTWIAPEKVTSVSVVAIGGGGGGPTSWSQGGGGGGGLGWKNNIPVTPGESYTVQVGDGGSSSQPGENSFFINLATVAGYGGGAQNGGTNGPNSTGSGAYSGGGFVGDGGGAGGQSSSSWQAGGGAGGYTGKGGNFQQTGQAASPGSGSASGGARWSSSWGSGGGGGVGLDGRGDTATGWITEAGFNTSSGSGGGGEGGSGGTRGQYGETQGSQGENGQQGTINGGLFGGGGGGSGASKSFQSGPTWMKGGHGGVKIIWGNRASNEPGAAVITRVFPDTNTEDLGEEE